MKKKLLIALALTMALGVAGCSKKEVPAPENPAQTENPDTEKLPVEEVPVEDLVVTEGTYFDKTSGYFNLSKDEKAYDGEMELYVTMNKISADADGTMFLINYKGVTGDRTDFEVDYLVKDERIVEQVYVKDGSGATTSPTLNSIIADCVILDGDIKSGNSWEQSFAYENKSYDAVTTITEAGDGKFTTETIVEGIEGYENETYKEYRTFELGKGMTSFYKTDKVDEATKESNLIGYTLK